MLRPGRSEPSDEQAGDETDMSESLHTTLAWPDIPRLTTIFTIEAIINGYTGVQNAGNPPHPPSEHPQPQSGSGIA